MTTSRTCERCSRGSHMAATRSHSNIQSKKRQFVNLQWKRLGGSWTRICANCIKAAQKTPKTASAK